MESIYCSPDLALETQNPAALLYRRSSRKKATVCTATACSAVLVDVALLHLLSLSCFFFFILNRELYSFISCLLISLFIVTTEQKQIKT